MATTSGLHPVFVALVGSGASPAGPSTIITPYQTVVQQEAKHTTPKEDEAKIRRQERNRLHAKKCRQRKKQETEELQQEAANLLLENKRLKRLVKEHVTDANSATAILRECCDSMHQQSDFQLLESLAATKQSYVITDPRLPDNPIIYVSDRFCKLTGFPQEQVVGRNCRFLQGPATDPRAVDVVRQAIASGTDCTTVMLNYKADGTPFWNRCFIAALRDWDGNIVNYVGVQCQQDEGPQEARDFKAKSEAAAAKKEASAGTSSSLTPQLQSITRPTAQVAQLEPFNLDDQEAAKKRAKIDWSDDDDDSAFDHLDWSILAETLEADFSQDLLVDNDESQTSWKPAPVSEMVLTPSVYDPLQQLPKESYDPDERNFQSFRRNPLDYTTRTVRSELIDALLQSQGDVSDSRFVSALSVLSAIYASSGQNASLTNLHNGCWRSVRRPHYKNCLGVNSDGDFVYTLGRMSFDMFKPGHLKCSIQRTLNNIETVCSMDGAPSAAPWSLRRELAAWDQTDDTVQQEQQQQLLQSNNMLKSYDIAVALTVEPSEMPGQQILSPRLRALNVTKGFMLPDPTTPNRLTVWFTGGKLQPAPASGVESGYGGLEEWKLLFGGNHKRTWSESFRVMGAKILLGAEIPDEMEEDGTMKYTLHRPVGGHGRTYVDVLYLDDDVLVLKSSSGIIHVMVRSSVVENEEADATSTAVSSNDKSSTDFSNARKRKWQC